MVNYENKIMKVKMLFNATNSNKNEVRVKPMYTIIKKINHNYRIIHNCPNVHDLIMNKYY